MSTRRKGANVGRVAIYADYLVIGSGVAGLTFALEAAAHGDVLIVTKRSADESNTKYAQGGIAAVLSAADSFEAHTVDTIAAGAGLCHERAVEVSVNEGPGRIRMLRDIGARFDHAVGAKDDDLDLHLEGGHSARRVAHSADMTGREVERALLDAIARSPRIRILEFHTVVDLITLAKYGGPEVCAGAYVLDEASGRVQTILARAVVLATGGAGKVYLYTTNPDVATGDGVAMAYRAGAEIANMEFYQFHPTCLYHPQARRFLITEAMRGEGAVLRLVDGSPFMRDHDPRGDLAPRDVVARAIDFEMKKSGADHVLLDVTAKSPEFVRDRFPNIYEECLHWGIDITTEPIPVVPAAHFMCGGVTTDLEGRSTIPGLWAIGECACTGLHGANRLASNSLLEGLVFAHRAAAALGGSVDRGRPWPEVPDWEVGGAVPSEEAVVITHNWDELRRLMWNYVGIVRSSSRLRRAARRIALLQEEIAEYYWKYFVTRDLLELRNIAIVAQLIVECAASRRETRGLHFTSDFPALDPRFARDTVIKRGVPAHLRGR
ncbi:MAG TPA: L-aspartate oxidase [Polyangiaceae bacterium]|nr:L-aspartate oxidase [Polyangiaceae bacterium]